MRDYWWNIRRDRVNKDKNSRSKTEEVKNKKNKRRLTEEEKKRGVKEWKRKRIDKKSARDNGRNKKLTPSKRTKK